MKKFIIFSLLLSSNLFSAPQEAKNVALNKTIELLSDMDTKQKVMLGFPEKFDVSKVSLAKPYKFQVFTKEFASKNWNESEKAILDTKQYRFPIVVEKKYVALVTVYLKDGQYEFGSLGANKLAKELLTIESKQKNSDAINSKTLIRNLSKGADVVSFDNNEITSKSGLIPLKSFSKYLPVKKSNFIGSSNEDKKLTLGDIHSALK